ncbi:AMP-dependent synthetase/ligase in alkane synthesis cluster [Lacipirellula parvula]|uniref:AMP-dependent synthetase/ligase in alkane synthesis cluster n=2 Tax=Lacipirellula parvula TaxID=2650471 RepID=A0A5K7XAF2_9BACT|nr:AMP-dependent synthetase/ligase in alkane synthesis cluster [Lacipirellula parvula]
MADAVAIATPGSGDVAGKNSYATCTFGELEADSLALARGLVDLGVRPGQRFVLLVKPGIEFVKLVFALLRTGAVAVLVDPGMGRKHLVNCLAAAEPDGFIAISPAQAVRSVLRRRFPHAKLNVTVGRRWFWGGATYRQVLERGRHLQTTLPETHAADAAAIIFTSGSTGPPKGVLYTHEMFDTQASEIERQYGIVPGGADLACFALFGLFNSAMGVTTVFPRMDFSRPASADPQQLLAAANDWQVSQAFASPAVWDRLSRHCEATRERIPTLRNVFSCGAPVPAAALERTLAMVHPEARMHTPYGATESLPVATIEAAEVLGETAERTRNGAGVCVGRKFETIEWRVIRISDEPIATIGDAEELPAGEIGELIVRGLQVSPAYVIALQPLAPPGGRAALASDVAPNVAENHPRAEPGAREYNAASKIADGETVWHRIGDVGYLDDVGRFWYCGRKSHRVETAAGTLYTECCEAVFNELPEATRTALVGIGPCGAKMPAVVYEPRDAAVDHPQLVEQLRKVAERFAPTREIRHFLPYSPFPVDVRHNSKINREQLAAFAEQALNERSR